MDQWETGYIEETSFDGIVYHVSLDENYLLTLTIFPMGLFFLSSNDVGADSTLHRGFHLLHPQS